MLENRELSEQRKLIIFLKKQGKNQKKITKTVKMLTMCRSNSY